MRHVFFVTGVVAALLVTAPGFSQNRREADELLERVAAAYRGMHNYYIEGENIAEIGLPEKADGTPGKTVTYETSFVTAVVHPDKSRGEMVTPSAHLISIFDGETTRNVVMNTQEEYTMQTAEASFRLTELAYERVTERLAHARILRVEPVDAGGREVDCTVVRGEYEPRPVFKAFDASYRIFWIDTTRNVVLKEVSDARNISNGIIDYPVTGALKDFRQTTTIRRIDLNRPVPDSLFVFTPPPAARRVETLFRQKVDLSGTEAIDFTLRDVNGRDITLRSLRGKVVLLDFWATWCGPCRHAMPILEKLHRAFRDQGLAVLGIDDEDPGKVRAFLERHGYTFPSLVDEGRRIKGRYRIEGIPTTILIDREGRIILHKVGLSSTTEDGLRAALRKVGIE